VTWILNGTFPFSAGHAIAEKGVARREGTKGLCGAVHHIDLVMRREVFSSYYFSCYYYDGGNN